MNEPRVTDMERWEGEWQPIQIGSRAGSLYTEDDRDGSECDEES